MQHTELIYTPAERVLIADTVMGGDVLRIVLDGMPRLRARNPIDALRELRDEHDDFRRFVIEAPRGHAGINACLLLAPFSRGSARTIIVAPQFGYAPIAGTPLMAAAVTLIETGEVPLVEPQTTVHFDTVKGRAEVQVSVENGRCVSARWVTARPKVIVMEHPCRLEGGKTVPASVISPGLPYGIVRAADLGVRFDDTPALGAAGALVSRSLGRELPLDTVGMAEDAGDYLIMIVGDVTIGDGECPAAIEVAWVSPTGWVAATPAGTGAVSVATYLVESGRLPSGEMLETYTPARHRFRCRVDEHSASVDAGVEIVALGELLLDPLREGGASLR